MLDRLALLRRHAGRDRALDVEAREIREPDPARGMRERRRLELRPQPALFLLSLSAVCRAKAPPNFRTVDLEATPPDGRRAAFVEGHETGSRRQLLI